jgi:hypothetical protein
MSRPTSARSTISSALMAALLAGYASPALADPPAHAPGPPTVEIGATDTDGQVFYLAEAAQYAAYYGQLFKVPVLQGTGRPIRPLDLTFTVTRTVGAPSKFRVLVAEVEGDTTPPLSTGAVTFVPTTVLWESEDLVLEGVVSPTPVIVDFKGLELEAGRTYAFLLDAFVLFDGSTSYTEFSGGPSSYNDGYFFFLPNPPGATRLENFGRTWITLANPGISLDFTMRFKGKPAR